MNCFCQAPIAAEPRDAVRVTRRQWLSHGLGAAGVLAGTSARGAQTPRAVDPRVLTVPAMPFVIEADDLGRIRAGARADLAMVDVSGLLVGTGALPPEPLNHLLYANGTSVRHVMTDGRLQVFEGRVVCDDESRVLAEGGRVVQQVWRQLEQGGWFR